MNTRLAAFVMICILVSSASCAQTTQLTLPGGSGDAATFDASNNLVVVTRTVPAGYMTLYPAYDGSYHDPVVIVEGIDPLNETFPSDVYATLNTQGSIDTIRAAGRSVWIVNFGDGAGAVSANAHLVTSAVEQAANYGGLTNAPVDVVGMSMGGVIARYALAYDEQHASGADGLVRLFISGDAPQQGANVNPSVQELVLMLNDPATAPLISSDAALSLMYTSVRGYSTNGCLLGALPSATSWTGSSAVHDWFYAQINALNGDGYPHKSRNLGVSNGTWNPRPYTVGTRIFDARTYATWPFRFQVCSQGYDCYALDVAPGSLGSSFTLGTIRQPQFEVDQHFPPTFIPADSALDVRGSVSMFDSVLTQSTPQDHGTVTPDTDAFIMNEVLGPNWRAYARSMPDGATANLRNVAVSAVFDGRFYVQQSDRTWGIAVISSTPVSEGDVVTVLGTITTTNGERQVTASSVTVMGQ